MTSVAHGNPFGFAGIDIKSYFMGFSGCRCDREPGLRFVRFSTRQKLSMRTSENRTGRKPDPDPGSQRPV
jgi:hypothetical protein